MYLINEISFYNIGIQIGILVIVFSMLSIIFCIVLGEYKMKKFSNKAYWNEYKASVKIIIFMTIMGELFKQYFINSLEHHPFKYGILYFIYSTLIFLFLFDTLHYWTHRFLHLPWFYHHFHLYHHLLYPVISIGTLSISFFDALIIGQISLWGPVFILDYYMKGISIITLYVITFIFLIYGLYLHAMNNHHMKGIIIDNYDHLNHHKYTKYNYGSLFRFWDWICNTYKV